MKIEEILVRVQLEEDIYYQEVNEKIAKLSQLALHKSEKMKKSHYDRTAKLYTFSTLLPTERDGFYKSGKEYFFKVRTLLKEVKKLFLYSNEGLSIGSMFITGTELRRTEIDSIDKIIVKSGVLYNISKKDYLTRDNGSITYADALHRNILKKEKTYKLGLNEIESAEEFEGRPNFIKDIIFREKKSQILYKGVRLVAEKFTLIVKQDEVSQWLAYVAIMTGLGQKNSSMGAGFVDFY